MRWNGVRLYLVLTMFLRAKLLKWNRVIVFFFFVVFFFICERYGWCFELFPFLKCDELLVVFC